MAEKQKVGIIGIEEVRLVGWEFDRWSDPSWRLIVGLKKLFILRLKSGWYGGCSIICS